MPKTLINTTFIVRNYMILRQYSYGVRPTYRVMLTVEPNHGVVKGDIVVPISGERWIVLEQSTDDLLVENVNSVSFDDVIGLWSRKEHYKIE